MILSARIIPGNEKAIFRMLDHMFRRRALVYYDNAGGRLHVSGHASQEEQKLILNLVRPKYFIPCTANTGNCSGTRRWRTRWECVGRSVLLEDGQPDRIHRRRRVSARAGAGGARCVDSGSLEEIEEVVIRDRQAPLRGRHRRPDHRHR